MKTLQQLIRIVEEGAFFPDGAHILLGVSGGLDSMALWRVLTALAPSHGWQLGVAHVHHGLRGAAADADAAFVRKQCRARGVPYHLHRADVATLATQQGRSIEMQARIVRYDFFSACWRRHRYDVLALAHTRDDQAETVLARILRGCSLTGLAAIRPQTERAGMKIVRPLLTVPKATLAQALVEQGDTWREDASNQDPAHLRNRLRHECLPWLRTNFNPQLDPALARLANLLQADDDVLQASLQADWAACCPADQPTKLQVPALAALPPARRRRLLWHWCVREWPACADTLGYDTVRRIDQLSADTDGQVWVPLGAGGAVVRTYTKLAVQPLAAVTTIRVPGRQKLIRPGVTQAEDWGVEVTLRKVRGYQRVPRHSRSDGIQEAYIAASAVGRAHLYLRAWQPGDRLQPAGMRGSRKIQDIFTDLKIPRTQRAHIPLLELRGKIIWVPGYTIDHRCLVPDAKAPAWHIVINPRLSQNLPFIRAGRSLPLRNPAK